MVYDFIYLLTAVGLSPSGSTQLHTKYIEQHKYNNRTTRITTDVEECGPCPVFASFTLAFALQLREKHGKTSVRVIKTSVGVIKTSVRVIKTSVRVIKTSGRLRKTSGRLRKTSEYSIHITKTPTQAFEQLTRTDSIVQSTAL
jgi:hypothetical protein